MLFALSFLHEDLCCKVFKLYLFYLGITDYMHKQSGEAAKLLTSVKAVRDAMNKEFATVIGFFDNLNDEKLRLFMDVGKCFF